MDIVFFFQIVAAVFVGGLLLAIFLWAGWTSVRMEKSGSQRHELPHRVYLGLIIPPLFVAGMVYLL